MRIISMIVATQLGLAGLGAVVASGCTGGSQRKPIKGNGISTQTLAGTSTVTGTVTSTATSTGTSTETDTDTDTDTESDTDTGTDTDTESDTDTGTDTETETETDTGTDTDTDTATELEATSTGTVVDVDDAADLAGFSATGLFRDIKRSGSSFASVEVISADDIRVAGHILTSGASDAYMMGFGSDGHVDQTFARKGRWRYSFSSQPEDVLTAMVHNAGGRLVVIAPEAPQQLISVRRSTGTFLKYATDVGASSYDPDAAVKWVINLEPGKTLVGAGDFVACLSIEGVLCADFGTMGVAAIDPGVTAEISANDAFVVADASSLRRYDVGGDVVMNYGTNGVSDAVPHDIRKVVFTTVNVESYVLGKTLDATDFNRVSRIGEDGHLDGTFGTGGTATVVVPGHPAMTLEFMTLQNDVVVLCGNDGDWICVRLTYAGTADATFGNGGGKFSTAGIFDDGRLNAITHDSLNRLLLAGESAAPGNAAMRATLMRLTVDGEVDIPEP